ncbi:GPP34 family phosphoprotein [Streptomyces bathyalis]|uniref:GPP34 family phosphoprotein n=1 Tax=Streptomyces bathyalis TaxID=2710756 RepID=A0A7T1T6Q1_9ACTN|nr:GPP34 family phosphoprotein [Streptomyces bathyalis]QPP07399.1 GPP34 family phosphoprotein [Streptomyces bathyalis]
MTTPRDLMITAIDVEPSRPVEQGELSLALAGAELIDLLADGAVTLEDDRIVPGQRTMMTDGLLDQATASLDREAPYEPVGDWLWRRGRGLAADYSAALEAEGQLVRQRRPWMPFRTGQLVAVESLDRRRAADRWAADEPVLTALATAVGIRSEGAEASPSAGDDAVDTVLAAVDNASVELAAERQKRSIEKDAFDNVWRGY